MIARGKHLLANIEVKWNKGTCVNVVLASKGYPGEFVKGYEIKIKDEVRLKIVKKQKEFENLKNKIHVEICPQCGEVKLYSKNIE